MPSKVPALPAANRLMGIDAARVVATLGVIWFHSIEAPALAASGVLGRSSVAFYTLAAMLFLVQSARRRPRPWHVYALDRARRLYLPFLGWSAVTYLILVLLHTAGARVSIPRISSETLVTGTAVHLWYLPFLFVASLLIYPLAAHMWTPRPAEHAPANKADPPTRETWLLPIAAAVVCAVIAILLTPGILGDPPLSGLPVLDRFIALTWVRWSAVFWGVSAGVLWCSRWRDSTWLWPLAIAGLLLCIGATAWQWVGGLSAVWKIGAGVGLLLAALAPWHNIVVHLLAPLGRLSAGIYFAHMALIYIVRAFLQACGIVDGCARDVVVFGLASAGSLGLVLLLKRTPGLRWLSGVEPQRPATGADASSRKNPAAAPIPGVAAVRT